MLRLQRQQVGSNYVGLEVNWPVTFCSLTPRPPRQRGLYTVMFRYGVEIWGAFITVHVQIDDYPRLKTARAPSSSGPGEGNSLLVHGWIEGRIVRCDGDFIQIEPRSLEFFD